MSIVNAQTEIIVDGGFDGIYLSGLDLDMPSANIGGTTTDFETLDWMGIFKLTYDDPISGSASAWIQNIDDQVAVDTMWETGHNPKSSGFAQQRVTNGIPSNPNNSIFSFNYKYTTEVADVAFALIQIIDAQNMVLWQGLWIQNANTTEVETGFMTSWTQGAGTGNPVSATIIFGSSFTNFMNDEVDAPEGSVFIVDDVSWVEIEPCLKPTNLITEMTNGEENIVVTWEAPNPAPQFGYAVAIVPTGATPSTDDFQLISSGTSYIHDVQLENGTYDVYVVSVCNDDPIYISEPAVVTVIIGEGDVGSLDHNVFFIEVYPNPAKNMINFKVEGVKEGSIEMVNTMGQSVLNTLISNTVQSLDIRSLNNGVYIYIIRDVTGNVLKKNRLIISK